MEGTKETALLMMDQSTPVESVYVEVWDDDAVRHESAAEIRAVNGKIEWDFRLGVTESDKSPCTTCCQDYPRCPGHWGHIEVGSSRNMYLRSSFIHKQLPTMILACICIHCRRPYYNFDELFETETKLRGNKLSLCFDYMTNKKNTSCSVCGKESYIIFEEDNRNPRMNRFSEIEISDRENTMALPIHVFQRILSGLSVESRKTIGIEGLDTNDLFFSVLPVMPSTVRPRRNFEGKESSHQFTILYERIARLVEEMKLLADRSVYKFHHDAERELYYERIYMETLFRLKRDKPELLTSLEMDLVRDVAPEDIERLISRHGTEVDELRRRNRETGDFEAWKTKRRLLNLHMREFDNAYGKQTFQMSKAFSGTERFTPVLKKSEGVNVDMNILIKSKHGLVREKIMGKRVNFCARTVASPAPFRSRADEVWVPERFRDTLLMTEDVTEDLKPTLKRMAENGMLLYVILKNAKHRAVPFFGERTRWSEFTRYARANRLGNPVDILAEEDTVERQLIDGVNYIMLNRQPSIWRYSLGAFRVRFWSNATIGVPEVALKAFNGDFDGDEFNIWTIRDRETEAEVIQIYSPTRNILGNARNSTAYGLHFDPVTGLFMITRVVERKLPIPEIGEDYRKIADFLGSIESKYFEEQDERLTSRRYFRVFLRDEGANKVLVFSSEAVVPRDYFIDEVREHITNMKGSNLREFHQRLDKTKLFYIPESDTRSNILGRSYSGRAAFSLLLPHDFYFDNGKIKIEGGVLVKGTVGKSEIGAFSHNTIFHELTRLYGYNTCSQVIDSLVWFSKTYLTRGNTLSFGLEDYGFVGREAERETDRVAWVRKLVVEYKALYDTLKQTAVDFGKRVPELRVQDLNRILSDVKKLRATEEVKGFLAKYCKSEDEEEARGLLLAATTLEEK
jgi:DNA-directed RNA polymerase beta' subunit